ncbi:PID-CTERM protein-sorting domain-containing protein [Thalassobellus suaedae]|uniref:Uncharacterized protein n=1 Tax=Thalassobellus suaedae TaxID=3074124 RepID=A0ABY9XST3_9FLAO|nr:hypothetical protein RHP51_16845 [Flavobacteriaceae bacterium HL-DH14]
MTIQNKRIIASILFVLISFVCVSQTPGTELPPPGAPPAPPIGDAPIDGGVLVGAAFALFYGVRKLLLQKANNN